MMRHCGRRLLAKRCRTDSGSESSSDDEEEEEVEDAEEEVEEEEEEETGPDLSLAPGWILLRCSFQQT